MKLSGKWFAAFCDNLWKFKFFLGTVKALSRPWDSPLRIFDIHASKRNSISKAKTGFWLKKSLSSSYEIEFPLLKWMSKIHKEDSQGLLKAFTPRPASFQFSLKLSITKNQTVSNFSLQKRWTSNLIARSKRIVIVAINNFQEFRN